MKLRYLPLLLVVLLGFTTCEDDDDARIVSPESKLTVNFRAEYNDQPLAIQSETYEYPTGEELKLLLFQYYVSDLTLLPVDGSDPVMLSEIDLIRYEVGEGEEIERKYTVPTGEYAGIRFGLGVKPELNNQPPSAFSADFVLNENEFWNDRARYVFAKIEANAKIGNSEQFDTGLTYHMGSNDIYTTITFDQNFSVVGDKEITLVADVLSALSGATETFDITDPDQQRIHGGNQAAASGIWNRLAGQFTLED